MPNFVEDLRSIIEDRKQLFLKSNGATVDTTRQQLTGTRELSKMPRDFESEVDLIDGLIARIAKVVRKRRGWLDGGKEFEPEGRSVTRGVTRDLVLAEEGRSPIEVAYLFDYSDAKKVRELRLRHNRDPQTGERVELPLTAPAHLALATVEGDE